ncbi:hypothetical protein A3L09_05530 [Thermococcus profundus]|uniref:Uncharacterized protein n=1 Tax=Thermococcus profundus TaxID=49899 RepID=A0A2Z2M8E8_THEPR|nr:hypothetical protein [Thermococcus profundus]ASJ02750.1 hypothetical protein A3L09_05530 [Thermococcus profundus]
MRKGVAALSFLLFFLLLFSYFYLPSKSISDLYQEIPEQVRQNSQLVAAYYYSQTGFNGFREYQFAFYNPESKTLSIYTFETYKFLKIWPRMKKSKITCKTPFNYSLLATSPEKLKDFTNCDNCRQLLYKDKIYRNEEIENLQPRLDELLRPDLNYWKVTGIKSQEISIGAVSMYSGDTIRDIGFEGYPGALILPSQGKDVEKATWITIYLDDRPRVAIHYPENVTLHSIYQQDVNSSTLWTAENPKLQDIIRGIKEFGEYSEKAWRFKVSIWDPDTAWIEWIIPEERTYAYLKIGKDPIPLRRIHFRRVYITHCSIN